MPPPSVSERLASGLRLRWLGLCGQSHSPGKLQMSRKNNISLRETVYEKRTFRI